MNATIKLTKAQRTYLTNARDFGHAHYYRKPQVGGCAMAWTTARNVVCRKLEVLGLLNSDNSITEAGLAALA